MTAGTSLSAFSERRAAPASAGGATEVLLYVQAAGHPRAALADRLAGAGVDAVIAGDVGEALRLLVDRRFAACVIDLAGDRPALTAARLVRARHPALPLIGVVEPTQAVVAADALHIGIADLLPWPFEDADLGLVLANIRERQSRTSSAPAEAGDEPMVAISPAMRETMSAVQAAARSRQPVGITGEPGTGRQRIARLLHGMGGGTADRFVVVDCASLAGAELERELFGAVADRDGDRRPEAALSLSPNAAFRRAAGGTLYLAHLPEASARLQARLGRLLRDGEAMMADEGLIRDVDVRVVAAFDSSVEQAVADECLRRDLADRFALRIDVPPLRRRREDIPALAAAFVLASAARHQAPARTFSRAALALLGALPWRGNARELAGLVDAVVRSARRPVLQIDDVLEHARLDGAATRVDAGLTLREAKMRFERECITAALQRHHGRVGEAARALGIQRTNLYRKVRQLNVARSLLSTRR